MKEIKAWECDFCNKYYRLKGNTKRHQENCFNNPKNKTCLTCKNIHKDEHWWCDVKEKDICSGKYVSDDQDRIVLSPNMECWV